MEEKYKFVQNSIPILGVSSKEEKNQFDKNIIVNFISNYLSYCDKEELKNIIERINSIGLIHLEAEQIVEPDYYVYDPDYVFQFIKDTSLVENDFLKPFWLSEELRQQVQLPENRFSDISTRYLDFTSFIHTLVSYLILLTDKKVEVDNTCQDEVIEITKDNIIKQLCEETEVPIDEINKFEIKNENNFLISFYMGDCLEQKHLPFIVFDFLKFESISFSIEFGSENAYLYNTYNKSIKKDYVDEHLRDELNGIIEEYSNKKRRTKKITSDYYFKIVQVLRKIIKNYNKNQSQHFVCAICKFESFKRNKKLKTNSAYCHKCWKLINLIIKIKKNLKENLGKKIVPSYKSIAKSLEDVNKKENYCRNILKDLEKVKSENAEAQIKLFKKKVKELLSINL